MSEWRNPSFRTIRRELGYYREVERELRLAEAVLESTPSYSDVRQESTWLCAAGRPESIKTPQVRLRENLSKRLNYELKRKGARKSTRTIPLLGCTIKAFMLHLENKFKEGMCWENYGKWQIDHIVPCALFDLTIIEHQRRCFHFSNLQPLWQSANASKGAKLFHEPGWLGL